MAGTEIGSAEAFLASRATRRLRLGLAFLLVLLLVLGVRLFQIQGLDVAGMAQAGLSKRLSTVPVEPVRGDILDADGNHLARTVERYNLVVDQTLVKGDEFSRLVEDPEGEVLTRVAVSMEQGFAELASILGKDVRTVRNAMRGEARFAFVAKAVTPKVKDRALSLGLPGLSARATHLRTYPAGPVAGSIVGFMGTDGPLQGLELTQNARLSGKAGSRTFETGGDGIRIPYATNEDVPARDGQSVRLTIDRDIQWFAQQTIASQVADYGADWGNVVVVEVETGNIIAMAESTTPDPNSPGRTPAEFREPFSVTESFEPGSVTKLITMAAALEEDLITPTSHIKVPPSYTVDGQTFTDAFEHGTERRTAAGILAKSMNTGTVMIGEQLTRQQRYDWLRKFGIGEPLGLGLNGETAGILPRPADWDTRQQYTVLFGQGLAQTAVHTAMAYQAVANDGVRLAPRLIDAYIDPDGTEHAVPAREATTVVSPRTAQHLQRMLETVTTDGSGASGALEKYRVGSKTGTAEAPSPSGGYDGYTLSYAGIAPLEDPKFVVVVTLQRPQGDLKYLEPGKSFQKVMQQVLTSRNVPPSTGKPNPYPIEY